MTAVSPRTCPSCRSGNPADAVFCSHCGVVLPKAAKGAAARPENQQGKAATARTVLPQWAVVAVILLIVVLVYREQRRSSLIPIAGVPEAPATPTASGALSDTSAPVQPRPEAPAKPVDRAAAPQRAEVAPPPPAEASGRREQRAGWYRVLNRAPLFKEPRAASGVITTLNPGTKVYVTRSFPGFLAVQSVTGKEPGYISADDVVAIADESSGGTPN